MIVVTDHAIDRYIERIAPVSRNEAERRIQRAERAIRIAAAAGCKSVRLGCGAKLVLSGSRVITVLSRGSISSDNLKWISR